jgi:hypothetical protein
MGTKSVRFSTCQRKHVRRFVPPVTGGLIVDQISFTDGTVQTTAGTSVTLTDLLKDVDFSGGLQQLAHTGSLDATTATFTGLLQGTSATFTDLLQGTNADFPVGCKQLVYTPWDRLTPPLR